ncbi:TraB/GumN family protein [Rapidithrix thailandica]|uniref:TraB/GumN family protein n=1 Tax=Rapidithrix thailandica TaxID=413964 RepID=A0AAW9RWM0_9BACT
MRIKHILSILMLMGLFHGAQGQLLWEIRGNGLTTSSYLYGTVHINDERVFDFSDSVMVKFSQCEVFAGEIVIDPMAFSQKMSLLFMPGDTTLQDLLGEKEYREVHQALETKLTGMSQSTERMKPLLLATLFLDLGQSTRSASNKPPLDLYFQNLAKENEQEVIGLETLEEQMAVFDQLPLKEQAKALHEHIIHQEKNIQLFKELLEYYLAGDLEGIHVHVEQQMDNLMFKEELLNKRNDRMVERILENIRSRSMFIGIGAAHLPGESGMIALLQEKGFDVRPVE